MDEREVGFLERELGRRLETDLQRVPVRPLETYLTGAQRAARASRVFSAATTALVVAVVVIAALGAGRLLTTLRDQGPAAGGSCGPLTGPQSNPIYTDQPTRVIRLDARGEYARKPYCIAGIRVYDGRFDLVVYGPDPAGMLPSWLDHFADVATITDDHGRTFDSGGASGGEGSTGARVICFSCQGSPDPAHGDLLARERQLTLRQRRAPTRVEGPWVFDDLRPREPASAPGLGDAGPLDVRATAAGHELRVYDLVVRNGEVFVGDFDQGPLGAPGPRLDEAGTVLTVEPGTLTDDRGTVYRRLPRNGDPYGASRIQYARYAPAPPQGARLRFTISAIYVRGTADWSTTIDIAAGTPVAASAVPTPQLASATPDLGGPAICSTTATIADRFSPATVAALSSFDHIAVVDVRSVGSARWNTPDGRWDPSLSSSERNWIYRPIDGTIATVAKGDAAAIGHAPLRFMGGSVGCHSFSMMPSPSIDAGSRYVVFLAPGAEPTLGFAVMEAWPVRDGLVTTPTEGDVPLAALLSILEPSYPLDFRPATDPFPATDAASVRDAVLHDPYYASVLKRLVVGPDPDPRLAGKQIPRLGMPAFVRSLSAGKPDEWLVPIEYGPDSVEVLFAPVDAQHRARLGGSRGWSGSFPMVNEAAARTKASTPNDPVVTAELVWAEVRATSMELEPFWRLVRRSGAVLYLFEGAADPVDASRYGLE